MPEYTSSDDRIYAALEVSKIIPLAEMQALCKVLRNCDFSVRAARNSIVTAINETIDRAPTIEEKLGALRFPTGRKDQYACTYDTHFNSMITGLISTLNYRSTNLSKEGVVASGSNNNRNTGTDQGDNDRVKRYEELMNEFCEYINNPDNLWNQKKFEYVGKLTWA